MKQTNARLKLKMLTANLLAGLYLTAALSAGALSHVAQAASFDFVPAQTGAQKEWRNLLATGNYNQALTNWGSAFQDSSFSQSANGQATLAYVLFKSGMPYTALERLFNTTRPHQLEAQLLGLWMIEIKSSPIIQRGWLQTQGPWKRFTVQAGKTVRVRNRADIQRAFADAKSVATQNVNESARILWQIATQAPLIGDVDSSLRALKQMSESGQTLIGRDMVSMTQGRVLYQKGELDAALNSYQQIPKGSSIWVEAVEERAWAHLRKEDYDKALGVITTALSPVLAPLAGPETFFLSNLMSLRVCDYSRLFKTSELFKTRQRQRLIEIQALAKSGTNPHLNQTFTKFETSGVSQESAGAMVEFMPRGLFRDGAFVRAMETRRLLLNEVQVAGKWIEQGRVLGLNSELENTIQRNQKSAESLKQQGLKRARSLAQTDMREYKMILNKMHILEAEVIERLHLDDNLKGERSKLSKNKDSKDSLVFAYVPGEEWMDELDNYQARVKDCPTLKGASL